MIRAINKQEVFLVAYTELKNFYYGDEKEYAKEYLNRFDSENAVKIDFCIGENQAFFIRNVDVMTLAFEIATLDKKVGILCNNLPGIAKTQYSKKCLIDEIVITNKIEGVHSSRQEISDALDILETQSIAKGKRNRFTGLVNKYLKLVTSETIPLNSSRDIRDIYNEIFLDEVVFEDPNNRPDGKLFRKNSVSVYSETGKAIHTGLLPEAKIIEAMEQALRFLNDNSVIELFRICIFHYFIGYIHPFYDGNGRLGRFLFSYGISKSLTPLISFRISETIKENIKQYYKAFAQCNDPRNCGDITPFLLMQLRMIHLAMVDLEKSLNEKRSMWMKYEKIIINYCNSDISLRQLYSYLIQAAMFGEVGITMQELQKNMKISSYLIKKLMTKIPKELIVIRKKSNYKFYSLDLKKLDSLSFQESLNEVISGG